MVKYYTTVYHFQWLFTTILTTFEPLLTALSGIVVHFTVVQVHRLWLGNPLVLKSQNHTYLGSFQLVIKAFRITSEV